MAIFVAISYQGLSFFPHTKFLLRKTKYTPPKTRGPVENAGSGGKRGV